MNSLVSVFPNTDLRAGHRGLGLLAIKNKRDPSRLDNGEFLLFINRGQTMFKLFTANNIVIHYKSPRGLVDIRTIRYIPECFAAGTFNYNKALELVLKKTLGKRFEERNED